MRTYSDDALTIAVAESQSWRATLEALGLRGRSAGSIRSVRRHADRLGLDYTHFTGQRKWSDRQLANAVAESYTWAEVAAALGLSSGSSTTTMRGKAVRLGLETRHLDFKRIQSKRPEAPRLRRAHLRRAGALLAAAWFELSGDEVSWPLEPCRYDLIVWRRGRAERVQVKTTTKRSGNTWAADLRCTTSKRGPYDPDDIDLFFIIDGDLGCYLIPIEAVAGRFALQLSAYEEFRLPPLALTVSRDQ